MSVGFLSSSCTLPLLALSLLSYNRLFSHSLAPSYCSPQFSNLSKLLPCFPPIQCCPALFSLPLSLPPPTQCHYLPPSLSLMPSLPRSPALSTAPPLSCPPALSPSFILSHPLSSTHICVNVFVCLELHISCVISVAVYFLCHEEGYWEVFLLCERVRERESERVRDWERKSERMRVR